MAKSLRSKWRRKCRAVKRVRYGQKELERLKKTLGIDDSKAVDVAMKEVSDIVTVSNITSLKTRSATKTVDVEPMDDNSVKHFYNPKTMKDQFGSYPPWMHQRRINRKRKQGIQKTQKSKSKKKKKN